MYRYPFVSDTLFLCEIHAPTLPMVYPCGSWASLVVTNILFPAYMFRLLKA